MFFAGMITVLCGHAQINTDQVMRIGRNSLYFEDYVLSIQYFNQVIKAKPFLAEPYFYRGIAKINLEDFKGAEEVLLPRCSQYMNSRGEISVMTASFQRKLEEKAAEMSERALRVLALAMCNSDKFEPDRGNLVFLGFAGMTDPPREEAKAAIRRCAAASVRTVMITGDHKNTAVSVAGKAGQCLPSGYLDHQHKWRRHFP